MTSNRYSTPAPVEVADCSPVASHVGMAVSGFPAECPVSGHMGMLRHKNGFKRYWLEPFDPRCHFFCRLRIFHLKHVSVYLKHGRRIEESYFLEGSMWSGLVSYKTCQIFGDGSFRRSLLQFRMGCMGSMFSSRTIDLI